MEDGQPTVRPSDEWAVIRPSFVRAVVGRSPYREVIRSNGLRLSHVRFVDDLVLSEADIGVPLLFHNSVFEKKVELNRSRLSGTLSFVGSELRGGINVSQAHIEGSVVLGGSDSLAKVAAVKVTIGDLITEGAHIGGDLSLYDATVKGRANLYRMRVRGEVILGRIVSHRINLGVCDCGGQIVLVDSDVRPDPANPRLDNELLNLFSVHAKSIFLNRNVIPGMTILTNARIDDLWMIGSRFGTLDMRGAYIGGVLKIGLDPTRAEKERSKTAWEKDAYLDLRDSKIRAISTQRDLSLWPLEIRFTNFSVSVFGFEEGATDTPALSASEWHESWLGRQREYAPQPYYQVRKLLQDSGDDDTAAAVGYRGRDRELWQAVKTLSFVTALYLFFSKFVIGYGYQMWLPWVWVLAAVLLGAVVFRRTPEARKFKMKYGLAYSFDILLPLVKLRELHYKIDLKGCERYYFYVHKLAGWVLGSFIVAGLSGFTK